MARVLVVEDHEDIRELVGELLRDEGYDVDEAENGQHALCLLTDPARPKTQLVLLDLAMPVMSGGELLRILEERGLLASLPVVVLSAGGKPEDARRARAFLKKPPSNELLLKTVSEYCGARGSEA